MKQFAKIRFIFLFLFDEAQKKFSKKGMLLTKITGAIRSFFTDDEVMTSPKLSVNKTQAWRLLKEIVGKIYKKNAKSGFPAFFDILLQLNTSLMITLKS